MDLILLVGVATALAVVLITFLLYQRQKLKTKEKQPSQRAAPQRDLQNVPRRAQILRNQRNRLRAGQVATAAAQNEEESEEEDDQAKDELKFSEAKIGTKKRAKLEAKAEKKAQREVEMQMREEKKKKEALLDEERKKKEQEEQEVEKKNAEAERLAKEEKERQEYEEYLKMKEAFSVEEEGFEEIEEDENLLSKFIEYIKENKVVILEELASHFNIKTQQAIERVTELQKNGSLTGVIDDRGKFIYISDDELRAVTKFIRQRGRVSITELAESSNKLINLNPAKVQT